MNPEHEEFEQLCRLLKIKGHEQPPPGYFNGFSGQVILRIKAGETGEEATWLMRLFGESPWFQRAWEAFEAKPAMAGALGVAVCGLLITGVLYSDNPAPGSVGMVPSPFEMGEAQASSALATQPTFVNFSSTNGVFPQARGSLFEEIRKAQQPSLFPQAARVQTLVFPN